MKTIQRVHCGVKRPSGNKQKNKNKQMTAAFLTSQTGGANTGYAVASVSTTTALSVAPLVIRKSDTNQAIQLSDRRRKISSPTEDQTSMDMSCNPTDAAAYAVGVMPCVTSSSACPGVMLPSPHVACVHTSRSWMNRVTTPAKNRQIHSSATSVHTTRPVINQR